MTGCRCRYAKRGIHGIACEHQQATKHMAAVESVLQAARWAYPVSSAIEANRLGLYSGELDGFPISGDHRPRNGRLYARGERVDSAP